MSAKSERHRPSSREQILQQYAAQIPNSAFGNALYTTPSPPKKVQPLSSAGNNSKPKALEPLDTVNHSVDERFKGKNNKLGGISKSPLKKRKLSLRERERIYDVNLATKETLHYEPLLDNRLQDYFSNKSIRSHLLKVGLITETGQVLPQKDFKKKQVHMDKDDAHKKNTKAEKEQDLDRDIERHT
ncbi:hypothetical protein HK100_006537 [Physocladia obscura]|uniref:Uncharacterized protein n=1 Tax=Physocladia obscura TaxID=109957 RepID=A0AAD5T707_9FUNG|nr:hypothetical protein HK100_006537 [Physocladia obscura]